VPGVVLILAGITLVGTDHPWLAPIVGKVRGWLARPIQTRIPVVTQFETRSFTEFILSRAEGFRVTILRRRQSEHSRSNRSCPPSLSSPASRGKMKKGERG
jgi:hypothetical protein